MTAPGPRDPQAEQDHAEWLGWAEANGYVKDDGYHRDTVAEAFLAGMQAARDLDAATLAAEVRAGNVRIETGGGQPVLSDDLQEELREAIAASERGETVDLGSFAEYAGEEDEQPAPGETELRRRIEDVARGLDHRVRAGSRTRMAMASSSLARILRDILAETAAGPASQALDAMDRVSVRDVAAPEKP